MLLEKFYPILFPLFKIKAILHFTHKKLQSKQYKEKKIIVQLGPFEPEK